ncbi:LysR family transcriptional regulator [Burkholderia cenocepacia]|uniref:LysR family transcriptional regulator n=1 Tax=Burkholderia cenocepacia TaxID=95486 RepID=UPI000489208F|nr:LysR family transcriptional regulator [Burkholderia cenocepacia]MBR8094348.1 LysR family transcriptional regulator [Burkholderia cenocepacia]
MLDDMMRVTHQSRNVDFFSFTVFLAVAARRSFRGAATELEITPSAVSHSVKALERRLGVRLLNRTTRSTSLTEAGERLAAKLRPAVSIIDEAMREVDDLRSAPSGTVRINASEGAIRLILRPVLARFLKSYPEVHLDIVSDGRLTDIVAAGFDAGIRLAEAVPQDMVAIPLMGNVRFAAVASPAYFAAHGRPATPHDLYRHDCIRFRFESGSIYQWEFERRGVSETIDVSGSLTLTDQPLMVDAAMDGIGIAFVPDHLVIEPLRDGRLERVLDDWCAPFPGLRLYYPGHRHVSQALRALIAFIKSEQPRS